MAFRWSVLRMICGSRLLPMDPPDTATEIDRIDPPVMHRARYRAPHDGGLQTMVIVCLAGPEGETLFCGQISDGGDLADLEMARAYLSRSIVNPLQAAAQLSLCKSAAARLVRSEFARDRIKVLAAALLRHGTLSGEQIHRII
jgi:hypothetical protein